jgi:cellulose synthase/poly-beta-1,6-N-acetylglucosamine synthase-like glycosyltransferase
VLTVLVPAHKGGTIPGSLRPPQILEMLNSLAIQTVQPDRIIILINNCKDDTPVLAAEAGAEVAFVPPNPDKKAGALNWWLNAHLDEQADDDLVMVMDADTILNPDFIENTLGYIARGYHAVGGVFLGKEGGGFIGMLQRNEYARYARDVQRRNGKALVLTGTATVFTGRCLKDVILGRERGVIPNSAAEGARAQVYDTKALTEDNELTFAILHLGYAIVAPAECGLKTEVMESWGDLARQRERWKRGAIDNNRHYGFTRYTWNYWRLQLWGLIGIAATLLYLTTVAWASASGNFHLHAVWLAVTAVYAVERYATVKGRGVWQGVIGASIFIEMPYDLFLQMVQLKAIVASTFQTSARW